MHDRHGLRDGSETGSRPGRGRASGARLVVRFQQAPDPASLERDWRALEARSDGSFFLSWDWIGCWLRESGVSPHLLVARRAGAVVGLALLQARPGRGAAGGRQTLYLNEAGNPRLDGIAIEFNGILVEREAAGEIIRACLAALFTGSGDRPVWRRLYLSGVTQGVRDCLAEMGVASRMIARHRAPLVDLVALRRRGGDYLATLGRNTRHQIRRSRRLYERAGAVTVQRAATVVEALEYLDGLKALHQASWNARGRPGAFSVDRFERFHRRLVETSFGNGTIDLLRIAAGRETIGYLYNFVHDGRAYNYQSGLAYGGDAKLKPGLLSHALAIEYYRSRKFGEYHFMAGDSRYKSNLSNDELSMYWLAIWRTHAQYYVDTCYDLAHRISRRFRRYIHG